MLLLPDRCAHGDTAARGYADFVRDGVGRVSSWPALSHQVFLGNEAFLAGAYTMMAIAASNGVHYMAVSRAVKKFETEHGNVRM